MRREPLQRATLRIKLHIPLIKLIYKDQVCYSAAPSTTNQNATQRTYIMDIKWLGNPYRHTVLKCSMKNVFKVIGCSCYTCLPQIFSCCSNCSEDGSWYWYWCSFGSSTSTHEHGAKNKSSTIHTGKQKQTLRNSTTIHKNSTLN